MFVLKICVIQIKLNQKQNNMYLRMVMGLEKGKIYNTPGVELFPVSAVKIQVCYLSIFMSIYLYIYLSIYPAIY